MLIEKFHCPKCGHSRFLFHTVQKQSAEIIDGQIRVGGNAYPVWSGLFCRQCKTMLPKRIERKFKFQPAKSCQN